MNRNKLWSDSLTKNYLTTYVEALACDNFDKRMLHNICRNDPNTWWVWKKCRNNGIGVYDSSKLLYNRVRIVSIDSEGFMSYGCSKVHMYLMLCMRICAIISKKEFYVHSMSHIHWHKMLNYYHGISFGNILATHSTLTINNSVCWTRDNCFRKSGLYKGVYVRDILFSQQLPCLTSPKSDTGNLVLNLMSKIIKFSSPIRFLKAFLNDQLIPWILGMQYNFWCNKRTKEFVSCCRYWWQW